MVAPFVFSNAQHTVEKSDCFFISTSGQQVKGTQQSSSFVFQLFFDMFVGCCSFRYAESMMNWLLEDRINQIVNQSKFEKSKFEQSSLLLKTILKNGNKFERNNKRVVLICLFLNCCSFRCMKSIVYNHVCVSFCVRPVRKYTYTILNKEGDVHNLIKHISAHSINPISKRIVMRCFIKSNTMFTICSHTHIFIAIIQVCKKQQKLKQRQCACNANKFYEWTVHSFIKTHNDA